MTTVGGFVRLCTVGTHRSRLAWSFGSSIVLESAAMAAAAAAASLRTAGLGCEVLGYLRGPPTREWAVFAA